MNLNISGKYILKMILSQLVSWCLTSLFGTNTFCHRTFNFVCMY